MEEINLLPWREQQRDSERRRFYSVVVLNLVLVILLVMGMSQYVEHEIALQFRINHRLKEELQVLDLPYQALNALKKSREELIARINVIQDLQISNIYISLFFSQLPHYLREKLYLYRMERVHYKVILHGFSVSNTAVAGLIRRLEKESYIKDAKLHEIRGIHHADYRYKYEFKLSFKLRD